MNLSFNSSSVMAAFNCQIVKSSNCQINLSLHTTVSISTSQRLHFINRHEVEIAINGVFQSRCSNSKLECLALCLLSEKAVDETA